MLLLQTEKLRILSDLLVYAAPDPLYFLRGSWEIHLCLLLVGFVFGICRFPQNCKPKKKTPTKQGRNITPGQPDKHRLNNTSEKT